ncbi:TPR_REGION domain-containing protein, partial [Haematococcus lacustris]
MYLSLGLVGAAVRTFEALELWDSLIVCYRLLDKKALAEEVIRRRLKAPS